jgi:hypothetical protein
MDRGDSRGGRRGELAELYDGLRSAKTGVVDNAIAIHRLHPETTRDHASSVRVALIRGRRGVSGSQRS